MVRGATFLLAALVGCAGPRPPAPVYLTAGEAPPPAATSTAPSAPDSRGGAAEVTTPSRPPVATGSAQQNPASNPSDAERSESNAAWRNAGWVTLGLAGIGAAAVAGTSYLMLHNASIRSDECDAQKSCSAAGIAANDKIASTSGWNIGAWVFTGVAAGVGTLLVVTHLPTKKREPVTKTSLGVSPAAAGAALTLGGTF